VLAPGQVLEPVPGRVRERVPGLEPVPGLAPERALALVRTQWQSTHQ